MSDMCRYCGNNPRKNCYAKEGGACEYPKYQRTSLLAKIERLQEENKLLRLERVFNRDNAMAEIERLNAFNTELCELLKQMHHVMALCVTALAKCGQHLP